MGNNMNNDVEALNLIDNARNISNLCSNNFELPFLAQSRPNDHVACPLRVRSRLWKSIGGSVRVVSICEAFHSNHKN